jgi:hypothetical protein
MKMTMANVIRAKILNVVTNRDFVIDVGKNKVIIKNMWFKVINDPKLKAQSKLPRPMIFL